MSLAESIDLKIGGSFIQCVKFCFKVLTAFSENTCGFDCSANGGFDDLEGAIM